MKKRILSVVACAALLITTLFSIVAMPASAASATLTVSDVTGKVGDTVEVVFNISANSYLVSGDFVVTYDSSLLKLVPNAYNGTYCAPNKSILSGESFFNQTKAGEFVLAYASNSAKGATASGKLFALKFEIIGASAPSTNVVLTASPLVGCNNGDDFDITPSVSGGKVTIQGGYDGWNFMQEQLIVEGNENVTVNADGSWTITGYMALAPRFTFNYAEYQYIAQWVESTKGVKIKFLDRDPLFDDGCEQDWNGDGNGYGQNEFYLYAQWVGPDAYPAGTYKETNGIKGVFDWCTANAGWGNTGSATARAIYIYPEEG